LQVQIDRKYIRTEPRRKRKEGKVTGVDNRKRHLKTRLTKVSLTWSNCDIRTDCNRILQKLDNMQKIFSKYGNNIKSSKQLTDIIEYTFFCV